MPSCIEEVVGTAAIEGVLEEVRQDQPSVRVVKQPRISFPIPELGYRFCISGHRFTNQNNES